MSDFITPSPSPQPTQVPQPPVGQHSNGVNPQISGRIRRNLFNSSPQQEPLGSPS